MINSNPDCKGVKIDRYERKCYIAVAEDSVAEAEGCADLTGNVSNLHELCKSDHLAVNPAK